MVSSFGPTNRIAESTQEGHLGGPRRAGRGAREVILGGPKTIVLKFVVEQYQLLPELAYHCCSVRGPCLSDGLSVMHAHSAWTTTRSSSEQMQRATCLALEKHCRFPPRFDGARDPTLILSPWSFVAVLSFGHSRDVLCCVV